MTLDKTLIVMKQQARLWKLHNKPHKAKVLGEAIVVFEGKYKLLLTKLWEEYNSVKDL